jgi:CelD/BcsL family acetyltransferase involved in cellulose biosynthesis
MPLALRHGTSRSPTNAHTPRFGALAEDGLVAAALCAELFVRRPQHVTLGYLDSNDPTVEAFNDAASAAGYRTLQRTVMRSPYLDVAGEFRAYRATRRSAFFADLRRRRRRLDEHGRVSFSVEHTGARLDEALAIEDLGWKGQLGTAIAELPPTHRFYQEVADWAASRSMLRLLFLRVDCRPIAFVLGLEDASTLYLLKAGYDPTFARFSPGQLTLQECISYAFEAGLRRVELLGADEPYKRAWAATAHEVCVCHAFDRSPFGVLGWTVEDGIRPLMFQIHADRVLRPLRDQMRSRMTHLNRAGGKVPWDGGDDISREPEP